MGANDEVEDNDKDDNNFKDISALGLDRDLGFSRGHQTKPNQIIPNHAKPYHTIPNQTKGISALGLDRDLGFWRGHQTKPNQSKSI